MRIYGLEYSEGQSLVMLGLEIEMLSEHSRDVNISSTKPLSFVTCIFLVPLPYITESLEFLVLLIKGADEFLSAKVNRE